MFEFHCWAVVDVPELSTAQDEATALEEVQSLVEKFIKSNSLLEQVLALRFRNGRLLLSGNNYSNRRTPEVDAVFTLFEHLSTWAPCSYGRVRYRDDDETADDDFGFQILTLCHGKLVRSFDDLQEGPREARAEPHSDATSSPNSDDA